MQVMTVRHFTEADIPARIDHLRDPSFQANLSDFTASITDDDLAASQRRTIAEEQRTARIFTICGPGGEVAGFAWISSIDWYSQCCELSLGVLPRYRGGPGALASAALHEYLLSELNMRVVVTQILDHNQMMQSAERVAARRQVICPLDSYTAGEWRAAYFWAHTETDTRGYPRAEQARRQALADRIRARIGEGQGPGGRS
jgi:RimJ/RimL family protein N-acetyltransferase